MRTGHRITLTYNLLLDGDATQWTANGHDDGPNGATVPTHWTDPRRTSRGGRVAADDSDHACATPTVQLQPYESQYEGYMGNYGNTVDRWYRRVPGLETISIGTELHALHSPAEKVSHTSVAKVWPLVREVVSRLG